jgi:SOS-response transcriptional repressor LexA
MTCLTETQQSTLNFIRAYIRENGMSPSIQEIASGMGWKSPNSAHLHLKALQRKGYLEMKRGTNRGLVLTDSPSIGSCLWSYQDHPEFAWSGSCGAFWQFIDGVPAENDVKFCPRCGKQVAINEEDI